MEFNDRRTASSGRVYGSDKNAYTKMMKRVNQSRKAKIENRVAETNKKYGAEFGKLKVGSTGALSTKPPKDKNTLKMRLGK